MWCEPPPLIFPHKPFTSRPRNRWYIVRVSKKNKKRTRLGLGALERDILAEVSLGDILMAHLLSARSTKRFYAELHKRHAARQHARRCVNRLLSKGLLALDTEGRLSLTASGHTKLDDVISRMGNAVRRPIRNWDHKWRLVAFDIPEEFKEKRDALRFVLKRAGFVKMQQSIWIHPLDCTELSNLLENDRQLASRVVYMVAEKMSDEKSFLRHFRLG